ncbi:hypothetical protein LCGC14_1549200 [marine sediment metagenome]|uniref:Uncharacterized protein n=1 Tax=marine sediment metagenome TaxID=412755 RepID=A0A0F9LRM7_9ZZZZ
MVHRISGANIGRRTQLTARPFSPRGVQADGGGAGLSASA